jgi:ATP-binding cassette subfamily F protein uup
MKAQAKPAATVVADTLSDSSPVKRKKLSYKEQRELDNLPAEIERLETEQQSLEQRIAAPDFYQIEREAVEQVLAELASIQQQLEQAIERWTELEEGSGA